MQDLGVGQEPSLVASVGIHRPEVTVPHHVRDHRAVGRSDGQERVLVRVRQSRDNPAQGLRQLRRSLLAGANRVDVVAARPIRREHQRLAVGHPCHVLLSGGRLGHPHRVPAFAVLEGAHVDLSTNDEGDLALVRGEGELHGSGGEVHPQRLVPLEVARSLDAEPLRLTLGEAERPEPRVPLVRDQRAVVRYVRELNAVGGVVRHLRGRAGYAGLARLPGSRQLKRDAPDVHYGVSALRHEVERPSVAAPHRSVIVERRFDHAIARTSLVGPDPDVPRGAAAVVLPPPGRPPPDVSYPPAVRRDRHVESAVLDHASGKPAVDGNLVQLRLEGVSRRREQECLAVTSPALKVVPRVVAGELQGRATVRGHDVYVVVPVAVGDEGHRPTIWRPGGAVVVRLVNGQTLGLPPGRRHLPDVSHVGEGYLAPVGRGRRRPGVQDRVGTGRYRNSHDGRQSDETGYRTADAHTLTHRGLLLVAVSAAHRGHTPLHATSAAGVRSKSQYSSTTLSSR